MTASIILTNTIAPYILVLLGAILGLIGWLGRQQFAWMHRIEQKVNDQGTDIAVIKAVMADRMQGTHGRESP